MSSVLTENVVLVRTRSHDLNSVKKLNCWGCTLKDVSIVNRMPNVEVISLSINSIETLQYFSACSMLQELYLRKNEIKDINEILYLSQLQFLKKLSLEDNPCANSDNYRLTVLKALPNLEFLDNLKVTAEEIFKAEKLGRDLVWPGTEIEDEIEDEDQFIKEENTKNNYTFYEMPEAAPACNETIDLDDSSDKIADYNQSSMCNQQQQQSFSQTNQSHESNQSFLTNRNASFSQQGDRYPGPSKNSHKDQTMISNPYSNSKTSKTNMTKANSLSDYNIYNANGNLRCSSPISSGNLYEPMNEYFDNNTTPLSSNHDRSINCGHNQSYLPNIHSSNSSSRTNIQSATSSSSSSHLQQQQQLQQQQRILPKGGKNRNANILSAVLCLIKELDYGSLEVVDTTIHCRMEEMDEL
ncbi:potassium voltage-gated channel subfamily KQT member 5 [Sarcoptes scabiei]|nr:potassium voltage-gated channel subfamily KQT member 5 [Sarcoptes scabiei]